PFFGGSQWILQKVRYGIDPHVLEDLKSANIDIDFAISYFREVIREIGVFVRVDRNGSVGPSNYSRSITYWGGRQDIIMRLSDGPRHQPLADKGYNDQGPRNGCVRESNFEAENAKKENEMLRAECLNLQSIVAREVATCDVLRRERDAAILERDALAEASTRWFNAAIAITPDHNPLASAPRRHFSWWRSLTRSRLNGQ